MILVDTSVWIDHLRRGEPQLVILLNQSQVLMDPLVIGELACGQLKARSQILELLHGLPPATQATHADVLHFIERHALHGRGIGYVDVHLCASAKLSGAQLWTRDKRLMEVAEVLGLAHQEKASEAGRP